MDSASISGVFDYAAVLLIQAFIGILLEESEVWQYDGEGKSIILAR